VGAEQNDPFGARGCGNALDDSVDLALGDHGEGISGDIERGFGEDTLTCLV
jgi:hypothetical protein